MVPPECPEHRKSFHTVKQFKLYSVVSHLLTHSPSSFQTRIVPPSEPLISEPLHSVSPFNLPLSPLISFTHVPVIISQTVIIHLPILWCIVPLYRWSFRT